MTGNPDSKFIKMALGLAKTGLSHIRPNPMVGCVIVKNNQLISAGSHKKLGLPHAEIEAINSTKEDLKGATLYVNLEPCCHFGKTPPCVDAIIDSQIKKVVCSTIDPNPQVSGAGIAKLKKAGIEVVVGVLEEEAKKLNEQFFTFHQKNRPFVALKFASGLDGKIATYSGDSKWITSQAARDFARNLRNHYQAVMVGINTIIKDDPHLGVRIKGKKDPLRIILDSKLKVPPNAQVLRDENVLIVTTPRADKDKLKLLKQKGIEILTFNENYISVKDLLSKLKEREIISLLVEGGGKTLGNFVDEKLVDKVYAFFGPIIIGGENAVSAVSGQGAKTLIDALHLKNIQIKRFNDDFLVTADTV